MLAKELQNLEAAVSCLECATDLVWTDKRELRLFKTRVSVAAKRLAMIGQLVEFTEQAEPEQLDIEGSDLVPANPAAEEIKRRSRRNDA